MSPKLYNRVQSDKRGGQMLMLCESDEWVKVGRTFLQKKQINVAQSQDI